MTPNQAYNLSAGDNATVTANDDGSFTITPMRTSMVTLNQASMYRMALKPLRHKLVR
ncbi:cadherin-like domain-containing protein [Vibrio chagasii]|nr:cadherin-like domain-containing protein [Vibrio chagasii]